MDIVIVSQYLRNIETFQDNNSRFVYLAKMLAEDSRSEVEIITSDFHHATKKHFKKTGELDSVKINALHESGYSQNVCFKRFASHKQLAENISKYLNTRKKPDICYCAIPSLAVAAVVARYCKENQVRFIVDIQDLWPEAFKMVFNIPFISDLVFYPMKKKADYVYKNADALLAVSQTYLNRALSVNNKCAVAESFFLGTELSYFDKLQEENKQEKGERSFYIGYIGTLGHSYNITAIIDAIALLNERSEEKYKFIIMGDGPLRKQFENHANEKNINVEFTGKLSYPEMVGKLCMCDIAVNPITSGSAGSIINKVGDYAAAGLPVINTQECHEYREMLQKYQAGITCENDDIIGIANAIESLCHNKELCKHMGENNRLFAEECFDRAKTYKKICELICNESISNKS